MNEVRHHNANIITPRAWQRNRWIWMMLTLLGGLLILLSTPASVTASDYDYLIVGIIIRQKDVATFEVLQQRDMFWLPLEDFAHVTGCRLEPQPEGVRIITPLGPAEIDDNAIRQIAGVAYLSQQTIAEKLHVRVTFDDAEFALHLDLPWRPGVDASDDALTQLTPDVLPPAAGLSTIRQDITYTERDEQPTYLSATTLGGRMLGGSWRVRWDTDFEDTRELSEYVWQRISGRTLWQAGQQTISLHPLLASVAFTGVQTGWTNQPLDRFIFGISATELLPRHATAVQTFRGPARPGYIAQLRVDGREIEHQVVGLNGMYEFSDVPLSSGHLSRIEVYVFDYHDARVPVEIHEITQTSSDLLLPQGGVTHIGGLGVEGNLTDELFSDEVEQPYEASGFYQWRYGLSDRLTLEAAVQRAAGTLQTQAGLVTRLGAPLILAAGIAESNGHIGYTADLDGVFARWRFLARSQLIPEDFSVSGDAARYWNNSLTLTYRLHDNVTLGLRARHDETETGRDAFVLPSASIAPLPGVFVRVTPDADQNYRLDGYARLSSAARLSFLVEDAANLDVTYDLNRHYTLSLGAEVSKGQLAEYAALLRYSAARLRDMDIHSGLTVNDEEVSYQLGANLTLLPGVRAELTYHNLAPEVSDHDQREHLLLFNLKTDFTFSGGRLLPADREAQTRHRGAIAGRLVIRDAPDHARYDLRNVVIEIGDQRKVTTDRAGNFFCGNLEEGVYPVELDILNLPFELAPQRTYLLVKVAANATTRVDFVVRPEFGIAGRVTDSSGAYRADIRVELFDAAGRKQHVASTDQFGLYRIDGLPAGAYTLRIAPHHLPDPAIRPPQRSVTLTDDFLFDQDLILPLRTP